jgi:hypothetical protein
MPRVGSEKIPQSSWVGNESSTKIASRGTARASRVNAERSWATIRSRTQRTIEKNPSPTTA